MRFSRLEVYHNMINTGMIPVFYHPNLEVCKQVVLACYKGGVKVFEFTNRGDYAHEVFAELNKWVIINCPQLILGIGSVVDAPTCALYLQLGANFIVSPILNAEMARLCNRRKVAWSPGCGSLTEISTAEELGAEIVKIFPGSGVGGPSFVAALKGPCPWTNVMPTGGVEPTKESLTAWFAAGVACVGLGSKLFPDRSIVNNEWEAITSNCISTLNLIASCRAQLVKNEV